MAYKTYRSRHMTAKAISQSFVNNLLTVQGLPSHCTQTEYQSLSPKVKALYEAHTVRIGLIMMHRLKPE